MSTLEARSGPSTGYSSSFTPSLKKRYLALLENDRLRGAPPPDNDPLDGLEVSEEDYWELFYQATEAKYEWNNGFLERIPMTDTDGFWLHDWFCDLLKEYFKAYEIAKYTGDVIGFRLENAEGEVQVRIPDFGLVLNENPVGIKGKDTRYEGTFDLCVESLSFSKEKYIVQDTVTKKWEYEQAGVCEYFILDSRGQETAFYRLNDQKKYEPIPPEEGEEEGKGEIIRSTVLPQFAFRLNHLKQRPPLKTLIDDPVYSAYVLLDYQQERSEKEKERSEKEDAWVQIGKEREEKEDAWVQIGKEKEEKEEAQAQTEKERAEKKEAQAQIEKERAEKEEAQAQTEKERAEKKEALEQTEKERAEKEEAQAQTKMALAEIERLKKLLS